MVATDAAKVQTAKDEVAGVVDRIQKILADVQTLVQEGRRGFQGTAAIAYEKAADAWDQEGLRLRQVLIRLEQQVGEGQVSYQKMELENETAFQALTNLSVR
ncbi:WXG100 family type VII secretion target [Nocardia otitidiscaviarum]|uniref:WXG100 family type VII secretion target n=1 Tax=Nocardia otitidiscaviarum TaxID=1823 RepID=UPI0018959F06|nr:WXG100 family type VII secretion target [Nocardia otitidiscaviarum]MBF6235757.1 WXG100 family type VII secretion target [Nocardia otitidiscaviarum]